MLEEMFTIDNHVQNLELDNFVPQVEQKRVRVRAKFSSEFELGKKGLGRDGS